MNAQLQTPLEADPEREAASRRLVIWLEASARGDRAAFRSLYDATSARLLGIAFEVLGDRDRAEEALQDSYVKIWQNAASFDPKLARPMTWLMRIVRNRSIDLWRSRQSAVAATLPIDEQALQIADERASPEEALAASRGLQAAGAMLHKLSPALRQAMSLALHRGLDAGEIAERCRITPARARARLREGVKALQRELALGRSATAGC